LEFNSHVSNLLNLTPLNPTPSKISNHLSSFEKLSKPPFFRFYSQIISDPLHKIPWILSGIYTLSKFQSPHFVQSISVEAGGDDDMFAVIYEVIGFTKVYCLLWLLFILPLFNIGSSVFFFFFCLFNFDCWTYSSLYCVCLFCIVYW
jgi:hypothetical protein